MSDADRVKWDPRYISGEMPRRTHPSEVLDHWLDRIGPGAGRAALDLACGRGRNALRMAAAGFAVDAVDISSAALAQGEADATVAGLAINWVEQDLDQGPLPGDRYAVIMVARFHARNTVPWLIDALADDGYEDFLVIETHLNVRPDVFERSDGGGSELEANTRRNLDFLRACLA